MLGSEISGDLATRPATSSALEYIAWDIDGTLVGSLQPDIDLFLQHAIARYLGSRPGDIMFDDAIQGQTASGIAMRWAERHGMGPSAAANLVKELPAIVSLVCKSRDIDVIRHMSACPGAHAALEAIHASGLAQTLLTGNYRPTAEAKLRPFRLLQHLDLDSGAYGDDALSRADLGKQLLARLVTSHRVPPEKIRVIAIGDTASDVICAKVAGFFSIAIVSGHSPNRHLLEEVAPDCMLNDLSDTQRVLDAITAGLGAPQR